MTRRKGPIYLIPDEVYPWEQSPDESSRAFTAFKIYMELRTDVRTSDPQYRNLRHVAERMGYKTTGVVGEWKAKYHWDDRIAAVDEWELKFVKQEELKQKIAMRKRHIALAQKVQKIGDAKLQKLIEEIERGETPDIDIGILYKLIESSVKLEQLSVGIGENDNTTGSQPVTRIEIIMPKKKEFLEDDDDEDAPESET